MSEIIKLVFLILAIIAIAVLIIKIIVKIQIFLANRRHSRRLSKSAQILEQSAQRPTIDARALNELLNSAYRLGGILEALYQLGEGQMVNKEETIYEWTMRINGMPGASYLQNVWKLATNGYKSWTDNEYTKCAKKISHEWLLSNENIKRDNRRELLVQDSTESEYSTIDGQQLPINTKAVILKSCWHYNGSVLEKGLLREEK